MTDSKAKNIYINSNLEPLRLQNKKRGVRVQYVNQDLDLAIKQMKQSVKNKSSLQQNALHRQQIASEVANPQNNLNNGQNSKAKFDNDKLLYTQTYKKKVQARLFELQQRKKQLNARSLQKQMKARLLRKIQQNMELKDKMDILKDVHERRQLLILQKAQRQKRRKQQQQMLHQSNIVNAEMLRKSKKKNLKSSLKDSRLVEQQSLKDHHFKNYLTQKQKQQKRGELGFRYEFIIRNKSSQGLRGELLKSRTNRSSTNSLSRNIKTSHLSRRNELKSQFEEQELIIQQYKQNPKQKSVKSEQNSQKVQKKYNSLVRQSDNNSNNQIRQESNKLAPEKKQIIEDFQQNQN